MLVTGPSRRRQPSLKMGFFSLFFLVVAILPHAQYGSYYVSVFLGGHGDGYPGPRGFFPGEETR